MNLEQARNQMLSQQIRAWDVLDDQVLETLGRVPRERFVPEQYLDLAFADTAIPLGHDQEMMAPKLEGRLLQSLMLSKADQVLEIGTGSGYLTACLARLGGEVTSVDIYQDFITAAQAQLDALGITNAKLECRDGLSMQAPAQFNAIAVTGSVPELDGHFVRMLKPGGRLFVIVGQPPIMEARLITAHASGQSTSESLFETAIPPLVGVQVPEAFVF